MEIRFPLEVTPPGNARTRVTAALCVPDPAIALHVFAHGAGAGLDHPFMAAIADRLAIEGIATLRFNFPYLEAGRRRPDSRPTLLSAIRAAIDRAHREHPDLPIFAGGKSMGGRMTSLLLAGDDPPVVRGVIFLGFPLHPAGKPSTARAEHLREVPCPMLFVQGTRDRLGSLNDLQPIVLSLGPRATLAVISGGDHGFAVRKKDGRSSGEVLTQIGAEIGAWIRQQLSRD